MKEESKKIAKLNFSTYLLVTSIDLTDNSKEKIVKILDNKIQPKHIITCGDLNYLLGLPSNYHVEFKYPELWMKSINVHQKIFHIGFINHSKFISDKLLSSLMNFVPFKQYNQILNHFDYNNVAIVSGNPGVGKTTLSYAIISHYIYFKGFQLIDMSYRKIQEAESFFYHSEPTIFFIDDFLGKIKLDKSNDYAQLLLFLIEKIENSENKKLIITSRDYILRRASKDLSPIAEINSIVSKYTIEIKSFTRRIRAEILYNHLKNSKLPILHIETFLQSDYKKIIDHKNYNPRIIEELTNTKLTKYVNADDYFNYFTENLRNPLKIWENVYDNLPNKLYKAVIIIRFLIEGQLPVENLEKAVNSLLENSNEYTSFDYDQFEYIMKELEGTFFTFQKGYDELIDKEFILIEFQNPSIIDFIDNFIWRKTNWLRLMIKNAIYFEQLFNWELLDIVKNDPTLSKSFREKILNDFHNLTNANIGFFEYNTEEAAFTCWTQGRYYYYLHEILDVVDIYEDKEVANFLKEEIFRLPFDGSEDISEKQSFCSIAEILIETGYINGKDAIEHYISGLINDIKELVCLEYMTRKCNRKDIDLVKKNKELANRADNLFLNEIETLQERDFVGLLDFFDDYEQIRFILPLKNTTKKLEELRIDNIWKNAYEKLGSKDSKIELEKKKGQDDDYFDIDDKSIDSLFESIKNNEENSR